MVSWETNALGGSWRWRSRLQIGPTDATVGSGPMLCQPGTGPMAKSEPTSRPIVPLATAIRAASREFSQVDRWAVLGLNQ